MHGVVRGGIQDFIPGCPRHLLDNAVVKAIHIDEGDGDFPETHRIVAGHLEEGVVGGKVSCRRRKRAGGGSRSRRSQQGEGGQGD